MKICFINSIQMFGGGEIWLFNTMKELQNRNHTVHLICRPGTVLEKRARERGFSVHAITMRGDFDPVTIWKTSRLFKKLDIDVVCTNMDKELRFGGIAAKIAGVKAVVPRRGIDYPLKSHLAYRYSYNRLASGVIANSKSTKKSLLKNAPWLDPDRIRVIYNGIDPDRFSGPPSHSIRREFSIGDSDFVIGFVGQLDERKGVSTLVKAFSRMPCTGSVLIMAGEGQREQHLKSLAEQTGAPPIVFTGFRDDIDDIMKAVDILVLPSLWEGFGIVLIEAMAAAKPVITTTLSNMPEIVRHNTDGLLIPADDEEALYSAMKFFMDNPDRKEEMGKTAQKKVRSYFTVARMVDETEKFFKEMLNN